MIVRQFIVMGALSATLALLRPVARARVFASACALSGLLVVDLLRTLLWVWPGLEQAALLIEFTLAAGLLLRAGSDLPGPWRKHAAARWIPRLFSAVCALAAAAAVIGMLELADYLGSGVIFLACVGIGCHTSSGARSGCSI